MVRCRDDDVWPSIPIEVDPLGPSTKSFDVRKFGKRPESFPVRTLPVELKESGEASRHPREIGVSIPVLVAIGVGAVADGRALQHCRLRTEIAVSEIGLVQPGTLAFRQNARQALAEEVDEHCPPRG